MKTWYKILDVVDDVAEIQIDDVIGDWIDDYFGFGITAKGFVQDLAEIAPNVKTIRVRINSPGGDVFGAIAMANALRAQREEHGRKIEVVVDGMAASAATIVMMAGDTIAVADNALVMVHNPWTVAAGNSADLQKSVVLLDELRDRIVTTYQWHSELDAKDLIELMDNETWMNAEDAMTFGFATEVVQGLQAAASIDPVNAKRTGLNVPEEYRERYDALMKKPAVVEPAVEPVVEPEPTVALPYDSAPAIAACGAADLSLGFAQLLIADEATPEEVSARIAEKRASLDVEAKRVKDIRALCARFEMDDLADGLVASGADAEAARQLVASVKAKVDRVDIDSGLSPDAGTPRKTIIDVRAIYDERAKLVN